MASDYVLLTSEALVAFIAAWLMRSLEHLTGENDVRDHFIFTFSSDREESKELTKDLLRAFNREQLAVLRLLLVEFSRSDPSRFVREHAHKAVKFIDSLCMGTE